MNDVCKSHTAIKNNDIKRCKWCSSNLEYVKYHDNEWGVPNFCDDYLLEMLILESFQAGLSWECVLNKRNSFREAYDNFNLDKICLYGDKKIDELLSNRNIIRNRLKVVASINNAKVFKKIKEEFGSFYNYLKTFTNGIVTYETGVTSSELSDKISIDLRKRQMKFVGTTIIYSYLQAIGVIYSHDEECFMYMDKELLLSNVFKIHTTEKKAKCIRNNLQVSFDIVEFCKEKILDNACYIYKKGKNYYCEVDDIIITINSYSYTIITACKKKL